MIDRQQATRETRNQTLNPGQKNPKGCDFVQYSEETRFFGCCSIEDVTASIFLTFLLSLAGFLYFFLASLHEPIVDEAVFGRAAKQILDGDLWLEKLVVYKPFMVYYLKALTYEIFGTSALAGRIPGIVSTLVVVWLVYRLAKRLAGRWAGLLSAFLFAFSPFTLGYLPTGTADALALAFVIGAADAAWRDRVVWSGFLFGLAFCTRQMVVWNAPLILALSVLSAPKADTDYSPVRLVVNRTWSLAKGALVPLYVLFLWSTKLHPPFSWIVSELSQPKYHSGHHLVIGFDEKLFYWISVSLNFFAAKFISVASLVVVPGCAIALWWTWRRGIWRPKSRLHLAVLFAVSTFLLFFYLVHSLWFFTTYARFMAPAAPWVIIMTSVLLKALSDRIVRRLPILKQAAPSICVLVLVVTTFFGTVAYTIQQRRHLPTDELPVAMRWVEQHYGAQARFITAHYRPEAIYAAHGARLHTLDYDRKKYRLWHFAQQANQHPTFLFLDDRDVRTELEEIRRMIAPKYNLKEIIVRGVVVSRVYKIEPSHC